MERSTVSPEYQQQLNDLAETLMASHRAKLIGQTALVPPIPIPRTVPEYLVDAEIVA